MSDRTGRTTDWDDDELWLSLEPAMFSERRLAAAPREVEAIIALLGIPPGSALLDLGCGPGRHAIELADRGYRVTGIDRTRRYIDRARRAAEERGVNVELLCADMRAFARPDAFDAALNLYTSFGLFRDVAETRRVAENALRSLRPGGAFLLEMAAKETLARDFRSKWWVESGGVLTLEERTIAHGWQFLDSRWIAIEDGVPREYAGAQRIFSAAELCDLLGHAGFAQVDLYGSFRGAPYDECAKRLVAVARTAVE